MHSVKFERRKDGVMFRAQCTCGWSSADPSLEQLQARAATHDLDWEEIRPNTLDAGPDKFQLATSGGKHGQDQK